MSADQNPQQKPQQNQLQKSQFVVAANRLPVRWDAAQSSWEPSPGGLVSAMMNSLSDVAPLHWVGWTGVAGEVPGNFAYQHEDMSLLPIPLSHAESELYYAGMSNATIWPLYHDSVRPPEFHRTWWNSYVAVNERFCDAIDSVSAPGATVWIHDYHLQLVPRMLRQKRPDVRIGFFLHIPFPPADLFTRLPFRRQIIQGLLGADVVGLQTARSRGNFCRTAVSLDAAVLIDEDGNTISTGEISSVAGTTQNVLLVAGTDEAEGGGAAEGGSTTAGSGGAPRKVTVGSFPIGIDVNRFTQAAASEAVQRRAQAIRDMLGVSTVLLGVDRLDYTKGIDIRMRAFGELLTEGLLSPSDCSMVQVAEPSRSNVNQYVELREEVEQLVGEINGLHGQLGRPAIHYFHQSQPFEEIVAMYLAADVMLVTPFRDGMNLVAKEFVATRLDDTGVLVLSEFTGSAELLTRATLVNPYDIDGTKRAILSAVSQSPQQASSDMSALRQAVGGNDVHQWVETFVACLNQPQPA